MSNNSEIKLDWAIQGKPYKDKKHDTDRVLISDDEGYVFEVGGTSKKKAIENASKIVIAVNSHDDLIETLNFILHKHSTEWKNAGKDFIMKQIKSCVTNSLKKVKSKNKIK